MALDPRALWENASAEGRRAAAARSAGNCAGGPTRLAAAVGFGAFGIVAFAGLARQSRSPSRTNMSDGRGGAPAAADTLLAMWDDLGACEAAGPTAGTGDRAALELKKVVELKELLKEKGLQVSGNKAQLVARLLEHEAAPAAPEDPAASPALASAAAPEPAEAAADSAASPAPAPAAAPAPAEAPAAADTLLATWDDLGACEAAGPAAPGLAAASGGAVASAAWPQGGPHQRVGFGKHSDLTYQQALDEDPDYCRWVLRSEATTDQCMLFKSWLQAGGAQEDQAEHVVNGGAHEQLVGTGKYKDRTYEDVLAEDPDYCGWVASLEDPGDKFAKFQSYIRENAVDIQSGVQVEGGDAKQAVGIGKYKDRTYEDVWNEDLDYCHWVLSLEEVGPKFAKFRAYLNERIQNA